MKPSRLRELVFSSAPVRKTKENPARFESMKDAEKV
jgi:hypothetical protein